MLRWQRFSDRARDVILLAREEACALKHDEIGVEHLLIGLLRMPDGVASRVLRSLDLSAERVRRLAITSVPAGDGRAAGDDRAAAELSFTADARDALFYRALLESRRSGGYIRTGHMLLGLIHDDDGAGARVLREVGLEPLRVRTEVLDLIAAPPAPRIALEPRHADIDPRALARFTDVADEVIALAQQEAQRLRCAEVCTEHILLAMLQVGDGGAARLLQSCGVTVERFRAQRQARSRGAPGRGEPRDGELPLSERALRALNRAAARPQPGDAIDTDDILLGILGVPESMGTTVLTDLGVHLGLNREAIDVAVETGRPLRDGLQLATTAPDVPQERLVTFGHTEAIRHAHHTAQVGGNVHASLDDLVTGTLLTDEGWPTGEGACDRLLEGAWPLAGTLLGEIADQLDRPLDAGDLLVLLASLPGGIAAGALSSLGIDPDALSQAVQTARHDGARSTLLWPADVVARAAESDRARAHDTELELLAERRDDLREQVTRAREGAERQREDLLQVLRGRLGLRSDQKPPSRIG